MCRDDRPERHVRACMGRKAQEGKSEKVCRGVKVEFLQGWRRHQSRPSWWWSGHGDMACVSGFPL
jgi:hypothetical protein